MMLVFRWLIVLVLAAVAGKLISRFRLPSILGWLIVGMFFGPHALGIMSQEILDESWYKIIIMFMQCAFGLMLGTELVWKKLKKAKGKIQTLAGNTELCGIVQGTIAAAAVINEIIAVIVAKKGFELSGEIKKV